MKMNSGLAIATDFTVFSIFLVLFSAAVYGLTLLADRYWVVAAQWRSFWLLAVGCCLLPIVVVLLPAQNLPPSFLALPDLATVALAANELLPPAQLVATGTDFTVWLCVVWMVLVVGVALSRITVAVLKSWQLRRWLGQTPAALNCDQTATSRYLKRLQRQKRLTIRVTERRCSPFVIGLLRPTLVISKVSLSALNFRQFQLMVRHELTHLGRADTVFSCVALCLRCLFWFNPFLLRLLDQFNWAVESSCDNAVLQKRPHLAQTYAQAMLNILRATQSGEPIAAVAFIKHTRRTTTMRMQRILNVAHTAQCNWMHRLLTACGVTVLVAGAFLVQPGSALAGSGEHCSWVNPVPSARLTSSFGQKKDRFHKGVDLAIGKGATVVAAADGKVLVSTDVWGDKVNYGKIIIIDHGDGLRSLYSHLDSRAVAAGDRVSGGDKIGAVGETGKVTGPHLHFEILKGEQQVDPAQYVELPSTRKQASLRLPPVM